MKQVALSHRLRKLSPEVRLLLSIVLGGVVFLLMPAALGQEVRWLAGWDFAVISFLVLVGLVVVGTTPEQTMRRSRLREPNPFAILMLVVLIACLSIFVIGFMLEDIKVTPQPIRTLQIWLSLIAVVCSWLLTHTMFALHYCRTYYNEVDDTRLELYAGGLEFPTDEPPDYLDFMYFSFTIGFTSQTSDVSITTRSLRRLVLLHEMISFFFYSVIIATTVNTVASLV
ncbi:hypothetical protein LEP3755_35120 [Leptolyngbya sp. NIES-3755]|nr:hypothetical protein LEP3755_35120 [Leptolyngbya sp. NIES-3755]